MNLRGKKVYVERRNFPGQFIESPMQEVNKLREIFRVWVPRGEVWGIDRTRPFLVFLTTVETVNAAGSGTLTLNLHANEISRVLNASDGHRDQQYVGVWKKNNGAVRTIVDVVDNADPTPSPGQVTISDGLTAATNYQVAYVPHEDGQLVLSVDAPVGLGERSHPIFEGDTKTTFTTNQWLHQKLSSPTLLPPDFSLVLKLKAPWQVAYENGATANASEIKFNQIKIPVIVYQERDFFVPGEPSPGHTLRKMAEARMHGAVR